MSEATEVVEAKPQDIATLPPADRAVIVMNSSKTEIQLRELVADKCDLCGAYQMGNYLHDIGGEIASGKHRDAVASASPLELAEIDAALSNACIASVRRVRND